jgi:cytochrome c-type biogenesis protein
MIQAPLIFFAGILSTFSPCVLPLLPIVMASSFSAHRRGPLFLVAGLVCSFVVLGSFAETLFFGMDISPERIQSASAIFLILSGLLLFFKKSNFLFHGLSSVSGKFESQLRARVTSAPLALFVLGCLVGAIWSPCTGPALAAAFALAANADGQMRSVPLLFFFGLGAAVPLLLYAYASQSFLRRRTKTFIAWGERARIAFGIVLLCTGIILWTGFEKRIESALLDLMPEWWSNLLIRF